MSSMFSGEGSIEQRKYRLTQLRSLSPIAKSIDFSRMSPNEFSAIEAPALAEARANAHNSGRLFASSSRDDGGRKITTFEGDINAWLKDFKSPGLETTINRNLHNENKARDEQRAFAQWASGRGK